MFLSVMRGFVVHTSWPQLAFLVRKHKKFIFRDIYVQTYSQISIHLKYPETKLTESLHIWKQNVIAIITNVLKHTIFRQIRAGWAEDVKGFYLL